MIRGLGRLLALLAVCFSAHGQVLLTGDASHVDVWPHVRFLADPAGALTADQAAAMREKFGPPPGAYQTLGMKKEVVWLRIPVATDESGAGTWIFDIDYALLRRVDVYSVKDGK